MNKIKKKPSVIINLGLIVLALYLVYSMISLQSQLIKEKAVLKEKQEKIAQLKIENDELERLLKSGSENEIIERAARDKIDFVFINEELYEDSAGK